MKDLEKIKEFFLKDRAMTAAYEAKEEYFKPSIRKDKSNPNFLYVDIAYPAGSDVLSVGGSKTMGGQDREAGAAKALAMGNNIAKKLQAKYNIEDIDVSDLKNGKVEVFAVSDDFIKMASPSLDEAKKETAVDMAKKQLDALGVKYEMSGNEFKPFKAIYKPVNKEDDWYDKFEEIVDLFNLGSAVKQSMSEAKEEDKVDTITMDIPLFLRMLEYSREDAKKDLDLHDVTEKANKLGKEKGILSMEDYDAIVSAAEEIQEGMGGQLDEPFFIEVSVRDARKALDLFDDQYSKSNIKMYGSNVYAANTPEDIYDLYYDLTSQDIEVLDYNVEDEELDEAELYEAYVPSNIKDFAKRKGVSSLVNKVAGWAEKVGKGIRGGTAIGKNYDTLILDMGYQTADIYINVEDETIELYGEPVNSFPEFKQVYLDNQEESDNGLEERIAEALNKINEELCPAGKAYIKRRKAAGEKSSAYLSGRAVKVCKGQMSGRSKKK